MPTQGENDMHTAICAFDDQAQAERAIDSLVRAGFPRHDLHMEHKHAGAAGREANDRWDGMEREVAVDRRVVSSFGNFFSRLFGSDNPSGHADTYTQHVERGAFVVVVDADDEPEARRASLVLIELEPGDLNLVHRPAQQPLRDIVGMRQERNREPDGGWSSASSTDLERDRATASNVVSPTTGPDLRDPDMDRAPGLRYADGDKDKPI
jgi:hypothetical protein